MSGQTYESRVPRWMGEAADAADCWSLGLMSAGLMATGAPSVEFDQGADEWVVVGPVKPDVTIEVNEAAVDAGGKALATRVTGGDKPFEDLPPHVRHHWRQAALDVLNASIPHLTTKRATQ